MGERTRDGPRPGGGFLAIVAIYALWLLTAIVAFAVCITWQTTAQRIYIALGFNKYGFAAFTYTVLIALILAWLVLVFVTEGWYRRAAEEGRLARRAAWMLGVLVGLVAVGMVAGWAV